MSKPVILIVSIAVLIWTAVVLNNYLSPFERCVRATAQEMRTESDAVYVCAALMYRK